MARGADDLRRRPWHDCLDFDLTLANVATRLTPDEWLKRTGIFDAEALQERTVVGAYPAGVSPCCAHDAVGNVWEWTRSKHVDYPYRPDYAGVEREQLVYDAEPGRVVRGGSFDFPRGFVRCAYRGPARPGGGRPPSRGVRVVASPFQRP